MKRVLYLHGLESNQGGQKVEFLANRCYIHAPEMDYTRKDIFPFLTQMMEDFEPELIIGSSMGGYTALMLGALYNIPVVAFNPAVHSRTFNPKYPKFVKEHFPQNARIILGEEDTVINPKKTLEYLKDKVKFTHPNIKIEHVDKMGHRIPLDIFINKITHEL